MFDEFNVKNAALSRIFPRPMALNPGVRLFLLAGGWSSKIDRSMTAENERTIKSGVQRPIILWPWLVGLAALALYGLTLNHWVTFSSLPYASQITGWDWHPGPLPWRPKLQYQPLFLILTFPLRWLPSGWRVVGLNVFTASCAALTLAILARSVRLLLRDRVKRRRKREKGRSASQSVHATFLPALFAVLLLAGQLTFWEDAVSGTGEMLDLLVFALPIYFLLKYRLSRKGRWLNLFAFVYGAGMTGNWALIGFFPCFLLALIWIQRQSLFDFRGEETGNESLLFLIKHIFLRSWGLVLRMIWWGGLGLLLYGLIPLLGVMAHDGSFWELLQQRLGEQHYFLTRIPRYMAVVAGMTTLVPLFFAALDWRSVEGDQSPFAGLTRALIRALNLVFLAVGVLMFFDVRYSPNPWNIGLGVTTGLPGFLSFLLSGGVERRVFQRPGSTNVPGQCGRGPGTDPEDFMVCQPGGGGFALGGGDWSARDPVPRPLSANPGFATAPWRPNLEMNWPNPCRRNLLSCWRTTRPACIWPWEHARAWVCRINTFLWRAGRWFIASIFAIWRIATQFLGRNWSIADRLPEQITGAASRANFWRTRPPAAGLLFASQLWQPDGGSLHDAAPFGGLFASLSDQRAGNAGAVRACHRHKPDVLARHGKGKRWRHCQNWQKATPMPDGSPAIIRKFWITGAPNSKRPGRGANSRPWSRTRTLSSWRPFASIRTT